MSKLEVLLKAAMGAAVKRSTTRHFLIGAAAIRADGALVVSRNECAPIPNKNAHAEARVLRKAGQRPECVVVARLLRNNEIGLAKPCKACEIKLRAMQAEEVYYTTEKGGLVKLEYGV